MGKCLSCCLPDDQPIQNGHPRSTTPTKPSVTTSQSVGGGGMAGPVHQKYEAKPPMHSVGSGGAGDSVPTTVTYGGGKSGTNGSDRKIFSQYAKLPPIRKTSQSEVTSKRTSFSSSRDFSEVRINTLFDQYKESEEEDSILADGIEKFCYDLEVSPEEFRVLVLAWKLNAETMCRFTRQEFVNGCKKMRVDSIKGIQAKFPEILSEVQNKQTFKDLYRWTYKFGLDSDIGQRTLPVDMALSLWKLVFSQCEPPILKRWLAFLERNPIRGIPKDTWDMFLNFSEAIGDDLSSYDDTEAWPSLFDDFVEYENDRENQNVQVDKNEKDDF